MAVIVLRSILLPLRLKLNLVSKNMIQVFCAQSLICLFFKNPQTLENMSYVAFANWKVWVLKT